MESTLKTISIGLFVLACSLMACSTSPYLLGKIEGAKNQDIRLYLIQPGTLSELAASYRGKVIDSAAINADGSFVFTNPPKTEQPVLLELAIQLPGMAPNYLQTDDPMRSNYMPVLWQSGIPLHITANADQFQKSFSIKRPSEINKSLLNLRDLHQKAYQTHLSGKKWHIEEGSQLLEKEHATLQYQKQLIRFAKTTPHLMSAMVALRWVSPENDYEHVPEFLVAQCNRWKQKHPDHPWVSQLCVESDPALLPVLVESEFPDLQLPMLTNDTLSLSDVLGRKLTIIDLWASWCAPCRIENRKTLVPLWDAYHEQGLQIVAIGLESDASSWNAAITHDGANRWLHASHLQGDDEPLYRKMRVRTIPANFIVDDKGVVIAKNVHGEDLIDLVTMQMEKESF